MGFKKILFTIGGQLIKPFISIETSNGFFTDGSIDLNKPIIYVLENRGWTDLYALNLACKKNNYPSPLAKISPGYLNQWHSVYAIAPRQPFKAWLLQESKRSPKLIGILNYLKNHDDVDIQFIPTSIFWGRSVSKEKNWFRILFADSWAIAGRTRKAFTILFNGRQTLISFSKPIFFREQISNQAADLQIIDNLQSNLIDSLNRMRAATLGPDISHRRTLVRKLLSNVDVKKEIQQRKERDNLSGLKAALIARRYLYEIVADSTDITITVLQKGLTKFWNAFYSGIDINGSEQLSDLALTHSLVYVPCHRSHIDYLLLSYIIHSKALALPYVAAGKNLKMPIIGPILRGGGAFFIRRSFRGNTLYSTELFEYIALLLSLGMPIEYFIEGGRSRTGRLLKAKPGMLSMTVRAFLKYRKKPVAFVPVYIGYEKMLEGSSYASELTGKKKKTETFFASIRAILKIRGEFGKVYTNFGRPILLDDALDATNMEWADAPYDDNNRPIWLRESVNLLSHQILTEINASTSVNAINMLSVILLTTSQHSMDEMLLTSHIDTFAALLNKPRYSPNTFITKQSGKEQIEHAEILKHVRRTKHDLGDIILIEPSSISLLPYYRNNILQLFVLPSIVACCFNTVRTLEKRRLSHLIRFVFPYFKLEYFLKWNDDELDSVIDDTLSKMVDEGLLLFNSSLDVYSKPDSKSIQHILLGSLGRVISPVLELYYLIITVIAHHKDTDSTLAEVTEQCYLAAQHMSLIHEFNPSDFSDTHLIHNFITALNDFDYLHTDNNNKLIIDERFISADRDARILIRMSMRSNLLQLVKRLRFST